MKVLLSGLDTLVIGFKVKEYLLGPDGFKVLEDAKSTAAGQLFDSHGVGVVWKDLPFKVLAHGAKGGYEWIVDNNDINVRIARRAQAGSVFPEVYVRFAQEYLWREGAHAAYGAVRRWLESWCQIEGEKVSEAHICTDLEMPLPGADLADGIVSRARKRIERAELHRNGQELTGWTFGSGDIMGRLYDKTREILKTHKQWFEPHWKAGGWDGTSKVSRMEFQSRREVLKQFKVESYADLVERMPDMWRYFTEDWLSIRQPGTDKTRARWKVADWWTTVQQVRFSFGPTKGHQRVRVVAPRFKAMMAQAKGVLVTAAALVTGRMGGEYGPLFVTSQLTRYLGSDEFKHAVLRRSLEHATLGVLDGPPKGWEIWLGKQLPLTPGGVVTPALERFRLWQGMRTLNLSPGDW